MNAPRTRQMLAHLLADGIVMRVTPLLAPSFAALASAIASPGSAAPAHPIPQDTRYRQGVSYAFQAPDGHPVVHLCARRFFQPGSGLWTHYSAHRWATPWLESLGASG